MIRLATSAALRSPDIAARLPPGAQCGTSAESSNEGTREGVFHVSYLWVYKTWNTSALRVARGDDKHASLVVGARSPAMLQRPQSPGTH